MIRSVSRSAADAATTVIPPILLFLGNAGKVMIANLCATFAACSVGDVDVSYRYLRVHCFSWVLYSRAGRRPPRGHRLALAHAHCHLCAVLCDDLLNAQRARQDDP